MLDLFDRQVIGLQTVHPDTPAAGSALTWNSPEFTRVMFQSLTFKVATDANVADRHIVIDAYHGSTLFSQCPAPGHQVASETIYYRFAPCILGIDESDDLSYMWAPLTEHLFLDPQHMLRINILNIQVGDQISEIALRFYQKLPR